MRVLFAVGCFLILYGKTTAQTKPPFFPLTYDSVLTSPLFKDTGCYVFFEGSAPDYIDRKYNASNITFVGANSLEGVLPEAEAHLQGDTLFLGIYVPAMMGGGYGLILKIVHDSTGCAYYDFVLHDSPPIFKNIADTGYDRAIEVPAEYLKLILNHKKFTPGNELYGYIDVDFMPFFKIIDEYSPGVLQTYSFRGYFKCKIKDWKY